MLSWNIQVCDISCRVPFWGFLNFFTPWRNTLALTEGNGIHLHSRVNLDSDGLCSLSAVVG